ncbi:hypothetical protein ES319_A10G165800v1 [Gossypium barbadense]|uniref:Uncharacterized protein n=2 Tax=Gossypium TaxID=3633 RepID=A0A2P5W039_GOSBA|nr:hypothetical protein ES319_A10G165800v1 [Gossypium barbadense]PPR84435.1 hypothetical protein GOBAR_AA36276 [Gossypium barbadense]TYG99294.1 hypothetical protein ES288_A10G184500v1 [Gossypium darwinii]
MVSICKATINDANLQLALPSPELPNEVVFLPHPLMAKDYNGLIVGYVLAKMEDEINQCHGHIISLAVKLGLVIKLMNMF